MFSIIHFLAVPCPLITKPFSEEERLNSNLNLDKIVKNEIGYHIRKRIEKAYEEKEKWNVGQ